MADRPPTPPEQKPHDPARALGAGLTFAATVALFALGGLWLDGKLATSPLFVLVGIMLGLLGGTIHLLRVVAPGTLPFGTATRAKKTDGKGPRDPDTKERREERDSGGP